MMTPPLAVTVAATQQQRYTPTLMCKAGVVVLQRCPRSPLLAATVRHQAAGARTAPAVWQQAAAVGTPGKRCPQLVRTPPTAKTRLSQQLWLLLQRQWRGAHRHLALGDGAAAARAAAWRLQWQLCWLLPVKAVVQGAWCAVVGPAALTWLLHLSSSRAVGGQLLLAPLSSLPLLPLTPTSQAARCTTAYLLVLCLLPSTPLHPSTCLRRPCPRPTTTTPHRLQLHPKCTWPLTAAAVEASTTWPLPLLLRLQHPSSSRC